MLGRIEQDGLTGLVHVRGADGEPIGHIMATEGRLCFAAPAEGHRPIGEWLAQEDPSFRERVDRAVHLARSRKVRLCEALLAEQEADLPILRAALRAQTARALLAIAEHCPDAGPQLDLQPARADYDPRLTFSALDVLLATSSAADSAPRDRAQQLFEEYVETSDAALLLRRPSDPNSLPLPLAARGLEEATLQEVICLSRSAAEMSAPRGLQAAGLVPRVTVFAGRDAVWVCALGEYRVALIRTGREFSAGQIVGYALRLAAAPA